MSKKLFPLLLLATLLLAACSTNSTEIPVATLDNNGIQLTEPVITEDSEIKVEETQVNGIPELEIAEPAWFDVEMIDARTGEVFSINGYQGKVVLVETMAMWCSNCMKQQKQVLELHKQLGEREDFVSIGLDIDINENLSDLGSYVTENGFTWKYSVASKEVAREISNLYGNQYLNPPSTPMLIIDRHGEVHLLPFNIKSADDLYEALEPFLNEEL